MARRRIGCAAFALAVPVVTVAVVPVLTVRIVTAVLVVLVLIVAVFGGIGGFIAAAAGRRRAARARVLWRVAIALVPGLRQEAIVEPRDAVKGDMARSILYMVDSYRLPLPANLQGDMLQRWHEQDPPDDTERWRNFVIEGLQGNANPYIP
ncbi:MAG: endonuclease [Deltaproteobacteria bacterium]|nr:endonuclease [Deltaproteobacteria bacterium]